jgi:hypothetical protein
MLFFFAKTNVMVPIRESENIWKSCSEQFVFPFYFIIAVLRV